MNFLSECICLTTNRNTVVVVDVVCFFPLHSARGVSMSWQRWAHATKYLMFFHSTLFLLSNLLSSCSQNHCVLFTHSKTHSHAHTCTHTKCIPSKANLSFCIDFLDVAFSIHSKELVRDVYFQWTCAFCIQTLFPFHFIIALCNWWCLYAFVWKRAFYLFSHLFSAL